MNALLRPPFLRSLVALTLLAGFAALGGCRVDEEPSRDGTGGAGTGQAGAQNTAGATSDERKEDATELSRLREETLALAADTVTCVVDDECAALPLGSKPCGGAWEYKAYTTKSPNAGDLVTLANNLEKAEDEFNHAYNVQSDCAYVVEPSVACEDATCVLVTHD